MTLQLSFEIVQKFMVDVKLWPVLAGPFYLPSEVLNVEEVIAPLRRGHIEFRVVSLSKFDNVVEVRRTIVGYRRKNAAN